jgi:chromosome segregation ATPase
MTTELTTLEARRTTLSDEIAALKHRRLTGDNADREEANRRVPVLTRELHDTDNRLRELRREAAHTAIVKQKGELQPLDDELADACESLTFALAEFNANYDTVRRLAVALGSRIGASRHHPLSEGHVDHALRTWALGRLAPRFPGAADVPGNVGLPFRGAYLKRAD